jgi:putative spermidine/putrescine transport system substrate-binding protein
MTQGTIKRLFGGIAATLIVVLWFAMPTMPVGAAEWTTELKRELADDEKRILSLLRTGKWDEIVEEAKGQSVNWWMWSGDAAVNRYADQWVAGRVKELYDIDLKFVPIKDTVEGVNQVVNEKTAGKHTGGSVDLNWISGENFTTMMQGEMLFVNWPIEVPNAKYIDFDDPTISHHGLIFIGNNALAWSRFQYVFVYNSDKVENVPSTWKGVYEWCMAHPGKFTYPAPPHFTGRGILFSLLYELSGDAKIWLGKFDQSLWDEWSPKMWQFLNDMKPCLWRQGETYPETVAVQERLYGAGELDWSVSAYFATPGRNVDKGVFPKATRTMVVDIGTVSGTGAVGIPYNSSSKAAALVVANFLASPEAQYQKALPTGVADGLILSLGKLSEEWQDKFKRLPKHEATLPFDVLGTHQVPYGSDYMLALEQDWRKHVLKKQ